MSSGVVGVGTGVQRCPVDERTSPSSPSASSPSPLPPFSDSVSAVSLSQRLSADVTICTNRRDP